MSTFHKSFILASVLGLLGSYDAYGEEIFDDIELSGMLESELAFGISSGDLEKAEFVLEPEIGVDLTPKTRLSVIGRLRGDFVDNLEPGTPEQANRSELSKRLFVGNHVDIELREAYYAVGTRDDLLERGIIDQRGGFLRIGRKTHIDQLDAGNFTAATVEIDMIFIGQDLKKMQILTNHRTNTALFHFEKRDGGIYLMIEKPEQFWKISRYLIVEVKK